MDIASITLHVLFEEPFWVGIMERVIDTHLEAYKIVFGKEPKEQEICDWLVKRYRYIIFSPAVIVETPKKIGNPKRRQREVHKVQTTYSTKSQQALKLQQEQNKKVKKDALYKRRKQQEEYQFQLKQKKRKEKRRGR